MADTASYLLRIYVCFHLCYRILIICLFQNLVSQIFLQSVLANKLKVRHFMYAVRAGRLQGGRLLCPLPLNQALLLLANRNADSILGGACSGWGDGVDPTVGSFLSALNQPLT